MGQKKIVDFLSRLSENNSYEWMKSNRDYYNEAKNEFESIIDVLINELSFKDSSIQFLSSKDCIFRLNRDIRFSRDKRPYKEYFSAYVIEYGRKNPKGGLYLQIAPKADSLIAGGVHSPDKEMLTIIRNYICKNGEQLSKIVNKDNFKKNFGDIKGSKLKRYPKGFPVILKYSEYMKLKSFDVIYEFSDVTSFDKSTFIKKIIEKYTEIKKVNDFFNSALSEYDINKYGKR